MRDQLYAFLASFLLSVFCINAFADNDIYPEVFVQDCKAAYSKAERSEETDKYQARCSCVSEFFFDQNLQGEAESYYYGAFMTMIESNKQSSAYKLTASNFRLIRDTIRNCEFKME